VSKPLVVVESPTKVRTIKKYLGKEFNVAATVGHIKDLPQREIGIDIEKGFKPTYRNIPGKQKVISSLRKAAGDASDIYLAPDPDREGEAIAWHTAEVLKKKNRRFHRVLFHELTGPAIRAAMASPMSLNPAKYDAQQARRILDRLVGYQVSPILWRKVKSGLSAGRVQSVAVRIVCEREREIQAFVPKEYWSITAHLQGDQPPVFEAKLVRVGKEKCHIPDKAAADAILAALADADFILEKVRKKTVRRNPLPPFITSKLQQEAIRKLRFSAKKTMVVAQQLYEGIDLGPGEPEGLITYMRTDSTRIAEEAAEEAIAFVRGAYGADHAIDKPRQFKNRKKAQDAHEAIRPTAVANTPDKLARYLSEDQLKLYRLIWQRFVASQMAQALINQNQLSIKAGEHTFTASGSSVKFPGFMALYQASDDDGDKKDADDKKLLPPLAEGSVLKREKIVPKQHFTMPPPRFTEASLVKELEENGIGRPSTYAAILSTIREKGYVEMLRGQFRPSELGFIVNDLLVASFPDVFNVDFTARMEDRLDQIEAAEAVFNKVLDQFYQSFKKDVDGAAEGMLSMRGVGFATKIACPECGRGNLHIKVGRNGEYLACNRYPDCTFSTNYSRDEKGIIQPVEVPKEEVSDRTCPKCERAMLVKQGRYGPFLACSGYPECKHTESLGGENNGNSIGVGCPEDKCDGRIVEKTSRRGKIFFSCSRYPDCTFASWDKPLDRSCPICSSPYLVEKTTKRQGTFVACPNRECRFRESG
jgi:DNA topoisomerase-1